MPPAADGATFQATPPGAPGAWICAESPLDGAGVRAGLRSDGPHLLTASPPSLVQRRIALAMTLAATIAPLAAALAARAPIAGSEALLPAYAAALLLVELITAALLLGHFAAQPSPAILTLAMGYLFSGLLVAPWALTFPGVFAALGPAGPDQATAYVAALRRIGFPLFLLAYAAQAARPPYRYDEAGRRAAWALCAVAAAATALAWAIFAGDDRLPPLMRDARNVAANWSLVPPAAIALYLVALAKLWRRRRASLDLWLAIVVGTLLAEVVTLSYVGGGVRLSGGWWIGRALGLVAASVVLVALLIETTSLYARLARSTAAERRARESRLTAMEAMSATIAHEVAQPVASMVTNADAALRWLDKPAPDIAEAERALRRVVGDGHRAGEVIDTIRTLFRKSSRERVPVDMGRLIDDALARIGPEADRARVALRADPAPETLAVSGNPVQLSQAVSNLLANAIEATRAMPERSRQVLARCGRSSPGCVVVSVEDTGPGIAPELRESIFEAFFTTRPDGMGMGLMFSRTVIEAHGGRLWVEDAAPRGAALRFSLPLLDQPPCGTAEPRDG